MNAEPTIPEGNEVPPDDHGVPDGLPAGETESLQETTTRGTGTASETRAIIFAAGETHSKNHGDIDYPSLLGVQFEV
jgi:hypothetical protein